MKKITLGKKKLILLISLLLIATVAVGGTLAYLTAKTAPVDNTFTPAEVTCQVDETFSNNVKSDVSIKNTGDTDAYIRAALVITWKDSNGNVAPQTPVANTDYEIEFYSDSDWVTGTDGFIYYTGVVAPGDNTKDLIKRCEPIKSLDGYKLHVEIIAEAVQSKPTDAVKYAWNLDISKDGVLLVPNGTNPAELQ